MKKQMISVFVFISLSFQFIYSISTQGSIALAQHTAAMEQKESARKKLSVLFRKYGPSKVSGAIALIRKHTPKGLITRHKEAHRELERAQTAHDSCMQQYCKREYGVWIAVRESRLDIYRKERDAYEFCSRMHCAQEGKVLDDASVRFAKLSVAMVLIGDAALLSLVLGAVAVGARLEGRGVQRPSFVIPTPWRGPSPVYEPPAEK